VWRVLTQERAALQRLLRRNWRAQPVPQITFRIDFGPAKAERVEKILRDLNLNKKKARKSPHGRL
jgi:ribosome-binding factor A